MLDILKGFAGKFPLLAWIFPSALAVLAFWFFTLPMMPADWLILKRISQMTASSAEGATWLVGASVFIGILLNVMSTPLYRLLEGYSWPKWLRRLAVELKKKKYRELRRAINSPTPGQRWERGLALEQLARFPTDENQIAPTNLANAIRSFETYGKNRFNLDSQTMWTELCTVVPERLVSEQEMARAFVDLFVAALFLSCAFAALSLLVISLNEKPDGVAWLTVILPIALAIACYRMAVIACDYWSSTVQAIVNLGRKPLAESLGLVIPSTLLQERKMWGVAVGFVFFGNETRKRYGNRLNRFRSGRRRRR